jgi:pSer/pThr/pTyr-binding forkhead associated (FHA) protein
LFIVNRLPALIGRDANATVRIQNDLALSRRHAMLFAQHEELWIRDLDSRHGTAINGVQLHEQPLKSGDRITLGSTVLALQSLSRIPA